MTSFGFVFPGQGSQSVGMLDAWGDHPAVRQTLAEASAALGEDIAALIHSGPKEQLDLTTHTQPVMLAAGIACYRAWLAETGLAPLLVAGHSLGEYTALVAARSLEFDDALRLVRARGKYMQAAVPVGVGAMAAILKLEVGAIREVVETIPGVEVANLNTPEQTVISGTSEAVAIATEQLKTKGGRAIQLQVSAPFHSSLMQPARERLERDLALMEFHEFYFPVVANVTAQSVSSPSKIPALLSEQVTGSVRWVESVQELERLGVEEWIEFGPGSALTGMVKRIVPGAQTFNVANQEDLEKYVASHAQ